MNRWTRWMAVGWIGMWLVGGGAAAVAQEQEGQAEQKKPTAQEIQEAQAAMEQMMGPMMSAMLESTAKTLARQEIAENFATFTRNYYLALVSRGFSDEEAMRIVTSTGIPSAGTGKQ